MNIAVYCGSTFGKDDAFKTATQDLGRWIGEQGHNLVYGGSSVGLMGTVARTVLDAGGKVYGVEPRFFIEAGVAQESLTELYVVESMSERKAKMIELADVFVALPGGTGTLEEISEIMSRIRLNLEANPCYFLNINGFYNPLKSFLDDLLRHDFINQGNIDRYIFCDSVEELTSYLKNL